MLFSNRFALYSFEVLGNLALREEYFTMGGDERAFSSLVGEGTTFSAFLSKFVSLLFMPLRKHSWTEILIYSL